MSNFSGTILIEGVPALLKKLRAAGADLNDLSKLNHEIGLLVISYAHAPVKTGRLAASMRAGKGKGKAVIRAGYASRAMYAGVVHFGNPYRRSRVNQFLTNALQRARGAVIQAYERGMNDIFKKNNLT